MPTNLKNLYKSKGSTIKTTILHDIRPPSTPKIQPEHPPLATLDTNSRPSEQVPSVDAFDANPWDMEDAEGFFDSDNTYNDKPRRLHQVRFCAVLHWFLL
jgi:hypothetical protein